MKKIILTLFILLTIAQVYAAVGYTVTKTTDDGSSGTLRTAITTANSTGGSYSITIQTNGTLTLTSALPVIKVPLTINCVDAAGITISGNNLYKVFEVSIPNGTVSFKNLNIVNGKGDGGGGGVYAVTSATGKVSFENCTFSGCTATGSQAYGGAIESSADVDLLNCTFTSNSATDGGGAIEMLDPLSVLTVNHTTIAQNSTTATDIAGGIDLYLGKIAMTNSIVGNNSNGNTSSTRDVSKDNANTNTQASSYNLYTTAPFTGTGDLTNKTVGQLALSALANNGGMVQTMAISLSSLARNSGTGLFPTDARGAARDSQPDMGAYELQTATSVDLAKLNSVELHFNSISKIIDIAGAFDYLEVYDVTGKLLNKTKARSVQLSGNGLMIVRVYSPEGTLTRKIVL